MRSPLSSSLQTALSRLGRFLLVVLCLGLAILGAEEGLGLYDEINDPACKAGGITTSPVALKQGVTQVAWREKFRLTGLDFMINGRALRQSELEELRRGLTGSLYFAAGGQDDGSAREWDYTFRLEAPDAIRLPSVESVGDMNFGSALKVEMGVRFDVSCVLIPDAAGRRTAEDLRSAEFPANTPLTLTLLLDGPIAESLELRISYSKPPRSLFPKRRAGKAAPSPATSSHPQDPAPENHDG